MGIILVAYDGSELADKALEKAIDLKKEEDEFFLVHVIPTSMIEEFSEMKPEKSALRGQKVINRALSKLRERGINANGVVRKGDIAEEIIDFGRELQVDLIIVGEKGLSKVGRFSMGSVADKVMRYARRPVLVVK